LPDESLATFTRWT